MTRLKKRRSVVKLNLDQKFGFERSMTNPIFTSQQTGSVLAKTLKRGDKFRTSGGTVGEMTGTKTDFLFEFRILEGEYQDQTDWISKEAFVVIVD